MTQPIQSVVGEHGDVAIADTDPGGLDDGRLGMAQRLILSTDATVVRLLEACFGERIQTAGLVQETTEPLPIDADLMLKGDESVLRRATLLQGCDTGRNYVYAEAHVVLDRIPANIGEELRSTTEPIGRLLTRDRVETFRELLQTGRALAKERAASFGLRASDVLLFRTYRVIAHGEPVMLITEHFPPSFFEPPPNGGGAEERVAVGNQP